MLKNVQKRLFLLLPSSWILFIWFICFSSEIDILCYLFHYNTVETKRTKFLNRQFFISFWAFNVSICDASLKKKEVCQMVIHVAHVTYFCLWRRHLFTDFDENNICSQFFTKIWSGDLEKKLKGTCIKMSLPPSLLFLNKKKKS